LLALDHVEPLFDKPIDVEPQAVGIVKCVFGFQKHVDNDHPLEGIALCAPFFNHVPMFIMTLGI
jgi:hypothetical protein